MNNYLKLLTRLIFIVFGLFSLSACAKNTAYDTLQAYVEDNTIIGNYYTEDFTTHDFTMLKLNSYAPRQQPKYMNLNFQADGSIVIDNVDLNMAAEEHITGKFILQNGSWEKLKDNIYKLKFKGIYFAQSAFESEGEYEFVDQGTGVKTLQLVRILKQINTENSIF